MDVWKKTHVAPDSIDLLKLQRKTPPAIPKNRKPPLCMLHVNKWHGDEKLVNKKMAGDRCRLDVDVGKRKFVAD